jgi:hypothetical protein
MNINLLIASYPPASLLLIQFKKLIRLSVFNQIHEIVFHGKGGYDYNTIYNMPIWLREYTFHKLKDFYNQENKNPNEDSWVQGNVKEEASKNKKIQIPTYITKASKK